MLKYFDMEAEAQMQVDAFQHGLGYVLLQNGHPVAFAPNSLTAVEVNYPHIDKKTHNYCVWLEQFNPYVYGHPINVQTYYKSTAKSTALYAKKSLFIKHHQDF